MNFEDNLITQDNEDNEDFEKELQKTLNDHKKSPKPNSRPQSGYTQKPKKHPQSKQTNLHRFTKFVNYLKIGPAQIWGKEHSISFHQLSERFSKLFSYGFSLQEREQILKLSKSGDSISYKNFQEVGLWTEVKENITFQELVNEKSKRRPLTAASKNQLAKKAKKNTAFDEIVQSSRQKSFKNVPSFLRSSTTAVGAPPSKGIKMDMLRQSQASFSRFSMGKMITEGSELMNKSRLTYNQRQKQLEVSISQNILENKWNLVVMVSEINQWLSKQEQPKPKDEDSNTEQGGEAVKVDLYRVVNHSDRISIMRTMGNREEEVPHVVFVKIYEKAKKKNCKLLKTTKNNLKGTVIMLLDDNEKLNKSNLQNKIHQRDNELNFVLLEIMRLKNTFQHQNSILTKARINY